MSLGRGFSVGSNSQAGLPRAPAFRYPFFNTSIVCADAIPELGECHTGGMRAGEISVCWSRTSGNPRGFTTRAVCPGVKGGRLRRLGNLFFAQHGRALLVVNADQSFIYCHTRDDPVDGMIRHLIIDHLAPRLLGSRGALVLHASAVATSAGTLAMLGPSGCGKSTLAVALARAGASHLADDAVLLEGDGECLVAHRHYQGIRLWPDSLRHLDMLHLARGEVWPGYAKLRCDLDPTQSAWPRSRGPLRLLAIQSERGERLSLTPLRGAAAADLLLRQCFTLDWRGSVPAILARVSAVLATPNEMFLVQLPRQLGQLEDCARSLFRMFLAQTV